MPANKLKFAIATVLRILILCVFLLNGNWVSAEDPEFTDDFFDELENEFSAESGKQKNIDPLLKYNRFMFKINDKLFEFVIRPCAKGYSKIIPEKGRRGIGNFFDNLGFPQRCINNLLQLKVKKAGIECARFGLNTTVGLLGFRDYAKNKFDLKTYKEDFGQTLGHYKVKSGFIIVLPIFGISNIRDAIGLIPDYFLSPPNYLNSHIARTGLGFTVRVNHLSLHLDEYDTFMKDAVDPYTFSRDALQNLRKSKVEK